ncbi:MAG: hypothetical protein JSV63_03005 [Candidatus Aenigmatarchaeota archaeon]|nr:MAG: hypothetical protein JSV63_03005 [Candidatus Aenigmarchaeota archaeon]
MLFGELYQELEALSIAENLYGNTQYAGLMDEFNRYMGTRYKPEQLIDPQFRETEVPPDVLEAFRPLHEVYMEIIEE